VFIDLCIVFLLIFISDLKTNILVPCTNANFQETLDSHNVVATLQCKNLHLCQGTTQSSAPSPKKDKGKGNKWCTCHKVGNQYD
jgi:hypothetical protein